MLSPCYRLGEGREGMASCRIQVRVQPSARRSQIVGFQDDWLRVRVTAPPERGRANGAMVELFAGAFGVPKRDITLLRGAASREKLVAIEGLTLGDVHRRLEAPGDDSPDHL